ncbi:hypothetical protein [Streptomyces sp. BK208]|uniref:hypothetical protein n=1 Tax=Streptomyces sp. BK208 TaxID=2512150 RepID=UPI00141510CF|nr:hypothetical protein [Streptomyces sp. BK208]
MRLPFLLITQSPFALAVIVVAQIILDRPSGKGRPPVPMIWGSRPSADEVGG